MEKMKKHLEKAYAYISKISVSGDNVEPVAIARMEIREAYKVLEIKEKEAKENAAGNDALQQRDSEDGTGAV